MKQPNYMVISVFAFLASYHYGFGQPRFGVKAGGTVSSVLFSSRFQVDAAQASHSDIQKPVYTFYGGVVAQFKVGKTFIVRPSLEYIKKAWEVNANDHGRLSTFRFLRKYEIEYIELPVNLLLSTPLAKGKIYIGLGPYIAYALRGSVKVNNDIFDLEFKKYNEAVSTYLPRDSYKPVQIINHYTINRFDYGANGVMGYGFPFGLFLEAGVDIGVREISTSYERYDLTRNLNIRDPSSSVKYSIFRLGAGFIINNK